MPRVLLPLLALAALTLGVPTPALGQDEDRPRRCPSGSVQAVDRGGRVVLSRGDLRRYWGCLNGRRPVLIDLYGGDVGLYRIRLASPYLAYQETITSIGPDSTSLVLYDIRRDRMRQGSVDGETTDLVVSQRGVAVAIDTGDEGRPPRVHRLDATGAQAVLDTGAIDPRSLALTRDGTTVYWVRDGVARSARL